MPCRAELGGLAQRQLQHLAGVAARVVAEPIHHHLADHRPNAVRLGRAEAGVQALGPQRAVGDDRRGAGPREGAERRRRYELGGWDVEVALQGEDVPLEPGQEVEARSDAGIRQLREVRVKVDEARHDDPWTDVESRTGMRLVPGPDGREAAASRDLDPRIGLVAKAAGTQRGEESGAEGEGRRGGEMGRSVHRGMLHRLTGQPSYAIGPAFRFASMGDPG